MFMQLGRCESARILYAAAQHSGLIFIYNYKGV